MTNNFILYKIVFPNNKVYIGYTSKSLEERKKKHLEHAKHEKLKRTSIMNALTKFHPKEQWVELAKVSSIEEAHKMEILLIQQYNATSPKLGYNISLGGDGIKHSELTKLKISKASTISNKRRFSDSKNIEKQSKALKKHWSNPDVKIKAAIKHGAKLFKAINLSTGEYLGIWLSQRECARTLKVSPGWINNILKKRRISKTYSFSYVEEKYDN